MKQHRALAAPGFALLALASPLAAAPGGDIGTVSAGHYACELPGDALGPAGRRQPEADFRILNGSGYQAAHGTGNYLLTGDVLLMTSGPRKGERFRRVSLTFLRQIGPDGQDGELRCVRAATHRH